MRNKKSKILKFSLISLSLISIIGSSAITLASCSGSTSSSSDIINKGDGTKFAVNEKDTTIDFTLQEGIFEALSDETSMKNILNGQVSNLFYEAIKIIAENNATYSRDLKNKEEEIKDAYIELVDGEKKNSSEWEKNLQINFLDENGGTEESYKKIKLNEWAIEYFVNKIFEKSFIFVAKDNSIIKTPQLADLMKALNKIDTYSFKWIGENKLENFYAKIQEFVFNRWLKNEKPIIVNMSLWKYGTPKGGINSLFNTNIVPPDPETPDPENPNPETPTFFENNIKNTEIASTYSFPYFSNSADNENFSSIEKFENFIYDSKNTPNYKLKNIGGINNTAGLIDIPQNYTEDSSTYILAKTSDIYDVLYPEFAIATLALFYDAWATDKILDVNFSKELNLSNNVLDEITRQFVSPNKNDFNANMPLANIPTQMVNEMINQFGNLTSLRNAPLYSIDAFKIKNQSTGAVYDLSNFMLLRNEAGVHAISIDGYDHIKNSSTLEEAILKYGDIIIYRDILNQRSLTNLPGNESLSIDLSNELKEYFNSNIEFLITDFLQDSNPEIQKLVSEYFPNNYLLKSTNSRNFYIKLSKYLFYKKDNDVKFSVQEKLRNTKEKYSLQFGSLAIDNGLASPWIYNQNTTTGLYNVTNLYNNSYPIYGPNSYREEYINAINPYLNELNILPLTSTDKSFKFSQYIYSNNFYLNLSLKEFMKNNGTIFANKLKEEVLRKNVNDYFGTDINNKATFMKFNNKIDPGINETILNNQWINTYYGSIVFDQISNNKFIDWIKFNPNALANNYILNNNDIQKYKSDLFFETFNKKTNSIYEKSYNAFLVASTVQYLLEDPENDGKNRFMEYLKNEITFGKDYYFVWSGALNGKLDSENKNILTSQLLDTTKRLNVNSNNNYASKYFSNSGVLLNSNSEGNNLYASSLYGNETNQYNLMKVGNSPTSPTYLGYNGLQTLTGNSLPSIISEKLFQSPREGDNGNVTNKGLLYQYGSLEKLKSHIDSIKFISDLETLAENISRELSGSFDIDSIKEKDTIDEKKIAFKAALDTVNIEAFNKFEGFISEKLLPDNNTSKYFGAYAKQINFTDVDKTFEIFVKEQGEDIVYNLLIKKAMEDTYKNIVLNQIVLDNKFEIFDINAKNSLGTLWVKEDENV